MKVVIIGAGNVGFTSAIALSKVHDVLVVEKDVAKADAAKNILSVSVLHEDGSNPKVLEAAIMRIGAEIILSAVPDDGLNLYICMMAKRIKPSIKTVACLRDPDYIIKTSADGEPGIDLLISPEMITAEKILRLATYENAVAYDQIGSMNLTLATFRVERGHDLVGKVVMELDMPDDFIVVAIYRGENVILDNETAEIHEDDRLCVLGSTESIEKFNKLIGIDKEAKEFVILGASVVGIAVAELLSRGNKKRFVKIIDNDEENCRMAARELSGVIVVNADVADPLVLRSENVQRADVVVSVSNMDERNLLACMAALKFGTKKIISRYSTKEYEEIFKYTGIESIIGYHRVITNEITKNLIFDENAIITMDHDDEFFFSVVLNKKSALTGNYLGDMKLPDGVRITMIIREGKIMYPRMNVKFQNGDKVLVFTHMVNPMKLFKLLGQDALVEL